MTIDLSEITKRGVERSLSVPGDRNWHAYGLVSKYEGADADARALDLCRPDGYAESVGNLLTTAGLNRLTSLLLVAGGQGFNNANCRIGVGNSATAALVADTDLNAAAGAANRQFVQTSGAGPSQANGVVTVVRTFSTGIANFVWNEWGIDNGTVDGTAVVAVLLNHKVTSLGTKTSSAAWTFTVTITIT